MRVIYRKIRHALSLYIKRNVEKVWGARYTLGARYLSKNTVIGVATCFDPIGSSSGLHYEPVNWNCWDPKQCLGSQQCMQL